MVLRLNPENRCQDGLRPLRRESELAIFKGLAARHMENKFRFSSSACPWVGFLTVVVNPEFRKFRKKPNQVEPTAVVTFADFCLWNIVSAPCDSAKHARDVELGATQADVPDAHLNPLRRGLPEQGCEGAPSKRCLEREVAAPGNGALQQAFPLVPGGTICPLLGNSRPGRE